MSDAQKAIKAKIGNGTPELDSAGRIVRVKGRGGAVEHYGVMGNLERIVWPNGLTAHYQPAQGGGYVETRLVWPERLRRDSSRVA